MNAATTTVEAGWASLGGQVIGNCTVGRNADGRLEVFALSTDGGIWHNWQVTPGGDWSGWHALGGLLTSDDAMDTSVWPNGQAAPDRGRMEPRSSGDEQSGNPIVVQNADGRLEVFLRGRDGAIWHNWQVRAGSWSGWYSLGGVLASDPSVGQNADGRLEIFARGTDGAIWRNYQVKPGRGWSGWHSLGGELRSDVAIERNADGPLEIFARGAGNTVWHRRQTAAGE